MARRAHPEPIVIAEPVVPCAEPSQAAKSTTVQQWRAIDQISGTDPREQEGDQNRYDQKFIHQ